MVQVFITGATGYIGYEVALALRRAGHSVFALVRHANSPLAINLAHSEVAVIIGDILKPETFSDIAVSSDVLIHAAADYSQFDKVDNAASEAFLDAVKKSNEKGGKRKLLIYTSGILVYPGSKDVLTEETAADASISYLNGRIGVEQRFLTATDADGVVLRPSFVFGKRNPSFFYDYFTQATKGEVYTTTDLSVGWSHIHVDDLATAYLAVVETSRDKVKGQIFNVSDDSRFSNEEIAQRFSALAGYTGTIAAHPEKGWPLANKSVFVSSKKLSTVTGWTVKHKHLLEEAELYYRHWKVIEAHKLPSSTVN
eukprot:TRINITY_DN946_c0_g1_i3.p1 TRINITY_DN946_c0_g1~~TRINITY_DN946_c0_g1_i3.p1  ORF type:complete len:311 (-),score=51.63 TRINITY_DN946_c0_g1_i3:309-1241(-)